MRKGLTYITVATARASNVVPAGFHGGYGWGHDDTGGHGVGEQPG